ncbi:hypothetical protein SNEBB_004673 [Seison nebaliae]|nr:hypothetical protein SNEBB_004673 [Seison nebaliae]
MDLNRHFRINKKKRLEKLGELSKYINNFDDITTTDKERAVQSEALLQSLYNSTNEFQKTGDVFRYHRYKLTEKSKIRWVDYRNMLRTNRQANWEKKEKLLMKPGKWVKPMDLGKEKSIKLNLARSEKRKLKLLAKSSRIKRLRKGKIDAKKRMMVNVKKIYIYSCHICHKMEEEADNESSLVDLIMAHVQEKEHLKFDPTKFNFDFMIYSKDTQSNYLSIHLYDQKSHCSSDCEYLSTIPDEKKIIIDHGIDQDDEPNMFRFNRIIFIILFCIAHQVLPHQHHHHSHDHHHHHHDNDREDLENVKLRYSAEVNEKKFIPPKLSTGTTFENGLYAISSVLLISIAPFLILFLIPIDVKKSDSVKTKEWKNKLLRILLSFAAGSLLGDSFLHLLPHAIEHQQHQSSETSSHSHGVDGHEHHSHDLTIGICLLTGILTFLFTEKFVRFIQPEHSHSHNSGNETKMKRPKKKNKKEKLSDGEDNGQEEEKIKIRLTVNEEKQMKIGGYLNLIADFLHNFTDGLAIGASFVSGNTFGIITTITIFIHEIPHEIGDFAILIDSGCSRLKAIGLQLITALGALSGCLLALLAYSNYFTSFTTINNNASIYILPFTAGGFIYVTTVNILPQLLEDGKNLSFLDHLKEIVALLFGISIMILICYIE